MMNNIVNLLDGVFDKYHVQAVGDGYIDCICPRESIEGFIMELNKLEVQIDGFTWWCFSNSEHHPCGMGGPRNKYGEGFYSELATCGLFDLQDNDSYKHYLLDVFPSSSEYKECLVPGFWLNV